jgi:serine/threonine-protein kinase RsbW
MLAMTRAPNVGLAITNLPENVSLVRELLAGLAGVLPLGEGQLDDIKTVVSEACNNVVIHAYGGARGPLDVEIRVTDGALEIVVRDSGDGLQSRSRATGEPEGIGIPVIHALSDRVEFTGGESQGTEVRMQFDVVGAREFPLPAAGGPPDPELPELRELPDLAIGGRPIRTNDPHRGAVTPPSHPHPSSADSPPRAAAEDTRTATLVVAPLSLARSVLSRPLTALAARARFSIDRLSDVQLVTDAIAAHAGRSLSGSRLEVGVAIATRDLELRIGPLRPGMADQLIGDTAVGGLGPLIESLADELTVERVGAADVLTLRMLDLR